MLSVKPKHPLPDFYSLSPPRFNFAHYLKYLIVFKHQINKSLFLINLIPINKKEKKGTMRSAQNSNRSGNVNGSTKRPQSSSSSVNSSTNSLTNTNSNTNINSNSQDKKSNKSNTWANVANHANQSHSKNNNGNGINFSNLPPTVDPSVAVKHMHDRLLYLIAKSIVCFFFHIFEV